MQAQASCWSHLKNETFLQRAFLRASFDCILQRQPNPDWSKSDLLRLLGYLEGELQGRDITIATLRVTSLTYTCIYTYVGARCSSVVRAFAHGAMGRQIDPSWGVPIELFFVPASAP